MRPTGGAPGALQNVIRNAHNMAPNGRVYANIGRALASPMLAEAERIPARSEARGQQD
jgi:hypothetical protein